MRAEARLRDPKACRPARSHPGGSRPAGRYGFEGARRVEAVFRDPRAATVSLAPTGPGPSARRVVASPLRGLTEAHPRMALLLPFIAFGVWSLIGLAVLAAVRA